ncbi:hypothetical protein L7F22_063211 [Adiantum nelumboides]|nr:hypothetical protein [Adiantum nelumboides]
MAAMISANGIDGKTQALSSKHTSRLDCTSRRPPQKKCSKMESMLRWMSNDKLDQMTLWMLRRLLKFFLKKYIGPYIRGDLDLEQLDFQLCSAAGLNDVALNVDAINLKLGEYPIALKEGSIGRVTVTLLPKLNIEVDGVELHFVPKDASNNVQSKAASSEFMCETQQLESETENVGVSGMGGYSYLPVQEGVKVVANLFERLFFGVRVMVSRVYIALEEVPKSRQSDHNSSTSHCMLLFRIGGAEYRASRSTGIEGGRQGEEFSSFTSDISFQQMCMELVEVQSNGRECPISVPGENKIYVQPVSLMQDDAGLSGHVKLGVRTKDRSLDMPKVDADINLEYIRLNFTSQQIQQLLRVIGSYGVANKSNVATARGIDQSEHMVLSSNEPVFSRKAADAIESREAISCKPAMLSSQSRYSRSSLFPGAKLISDWVHWNGGGKDIEEAVISEEEFAASTEEFFDCLSGSGLWMWTCSALSAISAASSFASGSVLQSQEFARQVAYVVKVKIAGVSAILKEDHSREHMEAVIQDIDLSLQVCQRRLKWQLHLKCIEGCHLQNQEKQDVNFLHEHNEDILVEVVSASVQPLQALVEQSVPKFPVSLCEGLQRGRACSVRKKCFLRLSEHGHLAGVQVDAKHKFTQNLGGESGRKSQDVAEVNCHFQPFLLWIDACVICMLQKWAESFHIPAVDSKEALSSETGSSFSSTRKVHINVFFSSIRLWICSPFSLGSSFSKDHLLCFDLSYTAEKVRRPMVKLRYFDSASSQLCLQSATVSLEEGYIYLVSPSKDFEKGAGLRFIAHKVLSMSLCSPELASLEILFRSKSSGGISLAERAWSGVIEQQKGGTGGRKTSSEFAAATVTEATDENSEKMREDIVLFSSTCFLMAIPKVKVELLASHHIVVVEILLALFEELSSSKQTSNSGCLVDERDSQLSVSLDVGEAEIILHSSHEMISSTSFERKTNRLWEKYIINIGKLQMLHVLKLGTVKDATYFWLRHGNGFVKGLQSNNLNGDMLQLLTCRDNALGRGDGGGGNALATKAAGIEVSVISWPGGSHAEDMLITVALGGCTFMAHGGRLDWLPGLITFFSQRANKHAINYAIFEKSDLSATETSAVRLDASIKRTGSEASSINNYVLFSLDLHDAALCYEPGKEAASATNLRAKNTTEQFCPVACLIAAAAVRVSSNAISNTDSKDYEIWLRDVALLLADTTLRTNSAIDYTPVSLHQAGYVKVAGEAVMEAVVHINGEDGLQWGVECANNQLRVDTCHDTTAALGRLIAQIQQLFVPEVEHPVTEKDTKQNISSSCIEESCEQQSCNGSTERSSSAFNVANSKNAALFEEFLEDAFMFVRGCPAHPSCNCVDVNSEIFEELELPFDNMAQESRWSQDGGEGEDLRTPVSQSAEAPSFIEDYYVSKKSCLQSSSQSSSCRDSGLSLQNSQAQSDDFDMLTTADGSGGWYDGHSFKVVEDHVPALDSRAGSIKPRGNLLQSSKRRLGLSLKYPQSVGRVVFQDLNLRWRLYGGSDWPVNNKDPVSVPFSNHVTSGRQTGLCLEVIFHGVDLQHDTFPETGVYASRLALSIRDVRIYDCSKDAPWKKILGYHCSKSRPRESAAKALNLELESVRPDPLVPLEEYRLSVQLLPLLLHLDQGHIDFLTNFFPAPPPSSQQLHLGYEEITSSYSSFETRVAEGFEEVLLPSFQVCELQPFSIRVDYIPRRVDIGALKSGNYAELANLVSWKGIELELKHVRATGVHGWGTLSGIVVGEWLEDISRNQIHKLLKGLGPIRPLFAVGSGAAKLVVLPAEHYKRDRRCLLRGMRKGALAFLRSISLEAVGLGVQLAAGAHEILIQTESALGSVALSSSLEKVEVRTKVGQPGDMREGLQQACERLSQGLERTASSLIGNPLKAYHRAGTSTAVASALRAAPAAAVAPAAAAAGALHRALLGVRNSLDPEHRRESEEKHSGPPPE